MNGKVPVGAGLLVLAMTGNLTCRRVWPFVMQPLVKTLVKLRLVQILVVVAIIQMKTLKTEVEKGFM